MLFVTTQRRSRLTADHITEAALRLLDSDGLEGVTLRRLTTELGVQLPALYRHFGSKQDLMDAVAQATLVAGLRGLATPANRDDWAGWLAGTARTFHAALLAHRDGARVVAGAGVGRATMLAELMELTLRVLTDAGLDLVLARQAANTVFSYTLGYTIEEQDGPAESQTPDPGLLGPRYPLLADVLREGADSAADGYDRGLEFIVAGVSAVVGRGGGADPQIA